MEPLPVLAPCLPPVWARGGHAQTVIGHLLPSPKISSAYTGTEILLLDGDRLRVRDYASDDRTGAVVYLFHGLGGSADGDYMHRTGRLALAAGHRLILANHRGCGEGDGLAIQPYHSGRGEDLSAVIAWGRARYPRHRHLAIGFSLSGSALLNLLAGLRGTVKPDLAIAVNAPIDLQNASKKLSQGFNRIYDLRFVSSIRRQIRQRQASGHFDPAIRVSAFARIGDIDQVYTGPAGGFGDAAGYYSDCSAQTHLHRITTPTILLTAEDDPFVDFAAYRNVKLSPQVLLHAEKTGGHMGYVTRTPVTAGSGRYRWLDYALGEFIPYLLRQR